MRQAGGITAGSPASDGAARLLRKDVDIASALAVARDAPLGQLVDVADALLTQLGRPPEN